MSFAVMTMMMILVPGDSRDCAQGCNLYKFLRGLREASSNVALCCLVASLALNSKCYWNPPLATAVKNLLQVFTPMDYSARLENHS